MLLNCMILLFVVTEIKLILILNRLCFELTKSFQLLSPYKHHLYCKDINIMETVEGGILVYEFL